MINRPADWEELTSEQKRERRFTWLLESADQIKFTSPAAEQSYRAKLQRLVAVYKVGIPDRVPVSLAAGALPFYLDGIDYRTAINQYDKAVAAFARFNTEHAAELDTGFIPALIPARALALLDYKMYSWPGHGIPATNTGFQFTEAEYMKGNEYDDLIANPSDFWMRTYLPRIFGAFAPFARTGALTDIVEIPTASLLPLARPEVQGALQKLIDAGRDLAEYIQLTGEFSRKVQESGYLAISRGEAAKAPFDTLGDTLRGTQGIMKDMYRQPDKLLAALDVVANLTIKQILSSPVSARALKVWFPLHKGADGWMSQKQFETFYWPSLKKVMDAFIRDGLQVTLFVEGSYNTRLESITDFPKGSVHWQFDRTDMAKAKAILGKKFSIEGNVPTSLLVTGNPLDVKEYCRNLIQTCGRGGGYILAAGATVDLPKLENMRAMFAAVKEYGTYG